MKKLLLILISIVLLVGCRSTKSAQKTTTKQEVKTSTSVESKKETNVSENKNSETKEQNNAQSNLDSSENTNIEKTNVTEKYDEQGRLTERSTSSEKSETIKAFQDQISEQKSKINKQSEQVDLLVNENTLLKSQQNKKYDSKSDVKISEKPKSN